MCRIGGVQVNDSPVILSRILELAAERGDTTLGAIDDEQKRWMEWADRKLAVLLFPNITRSMTESMQAFSYIWDVPHFSMYDKVMNRYGGAVAMRLAQGKIKKKCVTSLKLFLFCFVFYFSCFTLAAGCGVGAAGVPAAAVVVMRRGQPGAAAVLTKHVHIIFCAGTTLTTSGKRWIQWSWSG